MDGWGLTRPVCDNCCMNRNIVPQSIGVVAETGYNFELKLRMFRLKIACGNCKVLIKFVENLGVLQEAAINP